MMRSTTGRLYPHASARCTWHEVRARGKPPSLRSRRTPSGVGDEGMGSTVCGIPTVRIPNTLPHPPALTAEAAPNPLALALQLLRLRLQGRTLGGALSRYRNDDLEDFLGPYTGSRHH